MINLREVLDSLRKAQDDLDDAIGQVEAELEAGEQKAEPEEAQVEAPAEAAPIEVPTDGGGEVAAT